VKYLRALTLCLALTVPTAATATPPTSALAAGTSSASTKSDILRWRCKTDVSCLFTQTKLIRALASGDKATLEQTQDLIYADTGPFDDESLPSFVYWATVLELAEVYLTVGSECRLHRFAEKTIAEVIMRHVRELSIPMDQIIEEGRIFLYGHFPRYRCNDVVHPTPKPTP